LSFLLILFFSFHFLQYSDNKERFNFLQKSVAIGTYGPDWILSVKRTNLPTFYPWTSNRDIRINSFTYFCTLFKNCEITWYKKQWIFVLIATRDFSTNRKLCHQYGWSHFHNQPAIIQTIICNFKKLLG